MKLLDRFLTWLSEPRWRNVAQADRFAREQTQSGCVAPGAVVEIEHVPVTIDGWCNADECTRTYYHSPCHYQTVLAAKRDRERAK